MTVFERLTELPELTGTVAEQVREDMALIAHGEELDLPWLVCKGNAVYARLSGAEGEKEGPGRKPKPLSTT